MFGEFDIRQKKTILVILILIVLTLAVYWQVQNFEFTNYDDQVYVTQNVKIQSGITWKSISDALTDLHVSSNWHPLTMMSHMLDWQLFGSRAGGHHWTSVIIHVFNTVLLFLLLNQLTGAIWRSAFVAALFAVHPINVESVAWVAERKNVLSTFFWILTVLFYVRYVKQPGWKRYLPVFVCFALGLMSKPMLVTLPFVLLLLDYWPLNRTAINTQNDDKTEIGAPLKTGKTKFSFLILEKIPLFVLTVISSFVTVYAAKKSNIIANDIIPLTKRVYNANYSYVLYLKKLLWPTDLTVFYPYTDIHIHQVLPAAFLLIFITAICCKYYKKYPYLAVGWFWYLGTMVPVIGLVQVGAQAMADRYAYIPFIGIFIIIVWSVYDIIKKWISEKVIAAIFLAMLMVLIFFTYQQVKYWENNYTLYNHAIKTAEQNDLPYRNLALHLIDKNKPEEAIYYFYKAIELRRNDPALHNSLGVALVMTGKYAEAEEQYKTALLLDNTHVRAHNNLGMVLMKQGKVDEALKHFQEAVRLQPLLANAHYQLAIILKQKGLDEKANYHYQEAVRINPEYRNK